ncbi:transglycosylase [Psychromicrobium sp. YIM B11713]|uniref:aggregation-promoting factor C-terminal-like domain-containing protein n=1 Tax=Psychromicrobium sp. YIM B11713 TaxID=3145233 RepID=UPI00374F4DE3
MAAPQEGSPRSRRGKAAGRRRAAEKSNLSLLWDATPKLPVQQVAAVAVAGVLVAGVSASQQSTSISAPVPAAQNSHTQTVSAASDAEVVFSRVSASSKLASGTPDADATAADIKKINDPQAAQTFAAAKLAGFGWGQDQMSCLLPLWTKESSWQTTAENPSSLAYGIAQSLPAEKMASTGADYRTNYKTQISWGLGYIKERYGSPCGAWGHSQATGWY